ncbi:inner nuclear membrane protein enriched at telomere/subtelomere region, partial [Linderina pennispora]
MDDDRYLESGFDPSTLKVSALRNILVKHSVEFPSNAKKSELLRIMQTKVLDKSKTLRKEARRQKQVKADSRDIEMVAASGSRASKHSDHSTDAPSTEPTEKRAQKLKKRKKRKHAETVGESDKESDSAVFTPAKHKQVERQRLGKRRLQKPAEEEEESGERESDMAKNKKKSVAEDRRSNFSDENPFQRSPATPERKRRRKAQGADKSATTPLSALRTSKPSDVSFQVSLPGTPTPKKKEEEDGSVVGSPQSVASPTSKGKG